MAATRSRNPPLSKQLRDRGSGPQGLRRPRFSFFRFTCQTARNREVPLPGTPESPPKPRASDVIGRRFTLSVSELRRRAIAPESGRRAVVEALYGPPLGLVNTELA